ncbi:hypothetical protein Aperf_G00000044408 [Anoplocephala perfoliata]
MQVSGSNSRTNEWSSFVPNGGFGVKRPPPLVGLGPSPTAVNYLQEELGHTMSPKSVDFAFINRPSQSSRSPGYATERTAQSDASWNLEMKELMGLGSPMVESGEFQPGEDSQESPAIRALADLFTCPATTFPLSVGLFYETANIAKSTNLPSTSLEGLQDDIRILLHLNTKPLPTFSAPLVLVPSLCIFIFAYLLAIGVKFEVGLSLGILGLFIHFFVLLSTKRIYKRICCLPAFVVVILSGISVLIDLLLLRIFDFNTIEMLTDIRVLPIFVIMSSIIFLGFCASIPSFANAAFAYLYRPKTPLEKAIETYSAGGLETRGKYKKKSRLLSALTAKISNGKEIVKSNDNCPQSSTEAADMLPVTSSCEVDILAKKEFATICDMLHAFNFYLQDIEQTRFVVMIDATDATSAVQLAGVFYQVHSLLLTQPNAPIAFVIATNITVFYEKPSSTLTTNETVFQESQIGESTDALNLIRTIGDCNHLVLFSVQLPIFLDSNKVKADSSTLQRLPGASSLHTLLQNSMNTTPITPNSVSVQREEAHGGPLQRARSKSSVGSTAGQINKAFTSIEEFGTASREAISEPSSLIKAAQSNTSLTAQNQSNLQNQQPGTSDAPSAVVKNVNTSRVTSTRAGAKGIAEIFLANEEMVEQNVPVIRTLVAKTAFTNRLLKLNSAMVSIKQLVNWIYLTQHWPFHMTWMTILLEQEPVGESASSPIRTNTNLLSALISKALEEISALPPVGSVLSGDDRDPAKLLHFILNQIDCQYSLVDLKHLVDNSLFLNPIFRVCAKDIREFYYGENQEGRNIRDVKPDLSNSNAAIVNEKPRGTRRDFYVTAPVPQSYDTLPQYFDSDFNGRSKTGAGTAVGENNNDSPGDPRSPLPVSIESEQLDKGLYYSNPFNLPLVPPCPIRLKCNIPMMELSKMTVDDICLLLSAISGLPSENRSSYQKQVRRQNINGQVLSVCDLTKLRTELQMNFGDWQLFNTFITYLRGVEASITDRSRTSQTASFAGDIKSPHGSLAVSSSYPYSQVLVSPSPFVLCNEQSQARGKNMFDVPVLVQQVPLESNVMNLRQNTDRTTSDFSFGSGTDEFELAWRRDAKPDSLNGNSKFQHIGKDSSSRQLSGHPKPVWIESSDRLSKSTHDLRTASTSKRFQAHLSTSRSGDKRIKRSTQRTEMQVPTPMFHSTTGAPEHPVQMVPAYISRAPETSGMIPVWYPTLSCVGETTKQQQTHQAEEEYSSESSSVSMDGTYDFPSEYSSGDRHVQQRHAYRQQCPPTCPHSHREHQRRRKSSRSSRSSNRTAQRPSSRRSSAGRCSQKSAEGCTCDYFLYEESQPPRGSTAANPWTTRSPRKISSPDLSDIEAMTSS